MQEKTATYQLRRRGSAKTIRFIRSLEHVHETSVKKRCHPSGCRCGAATPCARRICRCPGGPGERTSPTEVWRWPPRACACTFRQRSPASLKRTFCCAPQERTSSSMAGRCFHASAKGWSRLTTRCTGGVRLPAARPLHTWRLPQLPRRCRCHQGRRCDTVACQG